MKVQISVLKYVRVKRYWMKNEAVKCNFKYTL